MRLGSIVAACALVMPLQSAPASAQSTTPELSMRPAWITEPGAGDLIVYITDDFRKSAPIAPQPLNVVTIRRANPGDPRNSPKEDMDALFKYLKANTAFMAKDSVAFTSGRDLIRFYFNGDHAALAAKFQFPKATLGEATAQDWTMLRSISIPDFSRFIARSATSQAELQRTLFGAKVPPAEARTVELKLKIDTDSPAQSQALAVALRNKRLDNVTVKLTPAADDRSLTFDASMRFSEALVQKVMNETCADAAKAGGQCVSWAGRFQSVHVELSP